MRQEGLVGESPRNSMERKQNKSDKMKEEPHRPKREENVSEDNWKMSGKSRQKNNER